MCAKYHSHFLVDAKSTFVKGEGRKGVKCKHKSAHRDADDGRARNFFPLPPAARSQCLHRIVNAPATRMGHKNDIISHYVQ